jgi:TIR domain-containing protein
MQAKGASEVSIRNESQLRDILSIGLVQNVGQVSGTFEMSGILFSELAAVESESRLLLSCHTRQQSEEGERIVLTTGDWKDLTTRRGHGDVSIQRQKLLSLLRRRTASLGDSVQINVAEDYPLVDATRSNTLSMLLGDLKDRGLITDLTLDGSCHLTVRGWEDSSTQVQRPEASNTEEHPGKRRYEVAISFAGEQRDVARQIAERLKSLGVSVFFDEYAAEKPWGAHLTEALGSVYLDQSDYCLMLVSKEYVQREWPTHERRHALARALREREGYVLPLRFDGTNVPGLPPTIGYLELKNYGVEGVCNLLLKKLGDRANSSQLRENEDGLFPIHMDDLGKFAKTLQAEGFDATVSLVNGQLGLDVGPNGLDPSRLSPDTRAIFLPLWEINHPQNRDLVERRDFHAIGELRPSDWRYDRRYSR